MATSGTFAYSPEVVEWIDEAFERCGIDPATLKMKHLRSARRSHNLLFAEWEARGDKSWQIDEQTQTLTQSDPDYTPATGTLVILPGSVTVRRSNLDTPVNVISREQYAMIPAKTQEGLPTHLFFDLKANLYYLWTVPENSTDVLHYWRVRRTADVTAGAETIEPQKPWFNALAAGLAWQLSWKYAPARIDKLAAEHERAFAIASKWDRPRGDTMFSLGGG